MSRTRTKLVKGVVYIDEEAMDTMHENMLNYLDDATRVDTDNFCRRHGVKDTEAFFQYAKTCDAIAALTRYDARTEETGNMIIPKEALSSDLVKKLEDVDLGKDLMNMYYDKASDTFPTLLEDLKSDACCCGANPFTKDQDKNTESEGKKKVNLHLRIMKPDGTIDTKPLGDFVETINEIISDLKL